MTTAEIKTAWNTFKKESKKEISFDMTGACYMNVKQLQNGTATIAICCDIEYDQEIKYHRETIDRINGYTSWTDEEKKRSEQINLESIAKYENLKATYGTRANEAQTKAIEITSSAAFIKMAKAIGVHTFELELVKKWESLNQYQIRIHF